MDYGKYAGRTLVGLIQMLGPDAAKALIEDNYYPIAGARTQHILDKDRDWRLASLQRWQHVSTPQGFARCESDGGFAWIKRGEWYPISSLDADFVYVRTSHTPSSFNAGYPYLRSLFTIFTATDEQELNMNPKQTALFTVAHSAVIASEPMPALPKHTVADLARGEYGIITKALADRQEKVGAIVFRTTNDRYITIFEPNGPAQWINPEAEYYYEIRKLPKGTVLSVTV